MVMPAAEGFDATLKRWAGQGLRVLMLARAAGTLPLDSDSPMLPRNLEPLGLVAFSDGLQPDVSRVLSRFSGVGVSLRIISGDYPETVAALARRVGFGQYHDLQLVSGLDLARMSETERKMAVEDGHIFGRVSPDQKVEIIQILQRQGHYVAMIGDGVNDVLALKQAHVGIAMEKGSQACRRVADVVLLGNGLGILPAALNEGQRIVRASQDLLKLFLSRSLSLAVAILGIGVLGFAFPALPTHTAIPALLVIGIPTLALAAWAQPVQATGSSLRTALPFAIPAALSIGAVEGVIYVSYMRVTGDIMLARTIFTLVATLCGLVLILFLAPPSPFWTGISPLRGDRRITALALTMLALLALIMGLPAGWEFLGFASLQPIDLAIAVLAVTAWGFGLRTIWRRDLPRRWLGINVPAESTGTHPAPIERGLGS
jgi:cation-transporting ATPase E